MVWHWDLVSKSFKNQQLVIAYCWYILLGLAGLTAGRAVDVALWTAGRSILAIEAIMICSSQGGIEEKEIRACVRKGKMFRVEDALRRCLLQAGDFCLDLEKPSQVSLGLGNQASSSFRPLHAMQRLSVTLLTNTDAMMICLMATSPRRLCGKAAVGARCYSSLVLFYLSSRYITCKRVGLLLTIVLFDF
jgi:hypothetical protein